MFCISGRNMRNLLIPLLASALQCSIATSPLESTNIGQIEDMYTSGYRNQPERNHEYNFDGNFNFKNAVQQDPLRMRYNLQQQIDVLQRAEQFRRKMNRKLRESPDDHLHSLEMDYMNRNRQQFEKSQNVDPLNVSQQGTSPQKAIYIESEPLRRQSEISSESNINSLEQNLVKSNNFQALNELLNQKPHIQLLGLKNLLKNTEGVQKHAPQENVIDPMNSNSANSLSDSIVSQDGITDLLISNNKTPSIRREHLAALQAQLNSAAQLRARQALVTAQQRAAAHVQAQHRALALLQVQANEAAAKKIASHNFNHPYVIQSSPEDITQKYSEDHIPPSPSQYRSQVYEIPQIIPSGFKQVSHNEYSENLIHSQSSEGQHRAVVVVQSQPHEATINTISPQAHETSQLTPINTSDISQEYEEEDPVPPNEIHEHQNRAQATDYTAESNNTQYASHYAFGYRIASVKDKNDFGHEERREGKSTKGHYHVLLPDGRRQNVDYYADHTGYHAKVTYENVGNS